MRAYEILYEHVDQRTTVQKLRDVIEHPGTEAAVRAIAQTKLDKILTEFPEKGLHVIQEPPVATNIPLADMNRPFIMGLTLRDIYDNLCALRPGPSHIQFTRQGTIYMLVPPPFQGVSKRDYYTMIAQAAPGVRAINSTYQAEKGYMFVLNYL